MAIVYQGAHTDRLNAHPASKIEIPKRIPDCPEHRSLQSKIRTEKGALYNHAKRAKYGDRAALDSIAISKRYVQELKESLWVHLMNCEACISTNNEE